MSGVAFQWTEPNAWAYWKRLVCIAVFGSVTLLAFTIRVFLPDASQFSPSSGIERSYWLCTKILAGVSTIALVTLLPVYAASPIRIFECDRVEFGQLTLADFAGHGTLAIVLHLLVCIFTGGSTFGVVFLWTHAANEYKAQKTIEVGAALTWQAQAKLYLRTGHNRNMEAW